MKTLLYVLNIYLLFSFVSAYGQLTIPDYQFDFNRCLPDTNYQQKIKDVTDRQRFLFQQVSELDQIIGVLGQDLEQLKSAQIMAKQLTIYFGALSTIAGGIVFASTFTGAAALDVAGMALSRSSIVKIALSSKKTITNIRIIAGLKLSGNFLEMLGFYISPDELEGDVASSIEEIVTKLSQLLEENPFYSQNISSYIDGTNRVSPKVVESPYLTLLEQNLFDFRKTQGAELATPLRDKIDKKIVTIKQEREDTDSHLENFFLYKEQVRYGLMSILLGMPEFFYHTEQKKLAFEYDTAVLYREILTRRAQYFTQIRKAIELVQDQCQQIQ